MWFWSLEDESKLVSTWVLDKGKCYLLDPLSQAPIFCFKFFGRTSGRRNCSLLKWGWNLNSTIQENLPKNRWKGLIWPTNTSLLRHYHIITSSLLLWIRHCIPITILLFYYCIITTFQYLLLHHYCIITTTS